MGVLDGQQKAVDLPNWSAVRLLYEAMNVCRSASQNKINNIPGLLTEAREFIVGQQSATLH